MGRPSSYTPELAERFCHGVAQGNLMLHVCRWPGMPSFPTVQRWAMNVDEFRARLARAREDGVEANLERAELAILNATPETIAIARELAHHLRWKASKLKPATYGERVQHSIDGAAVLRLEFGRRPDAPALPDAAAPAVIQGEALRIETPQDCGRADG